jgi:acyl carrier protein
MNNISEIYSVRITEGVTNLEKDYRLYVNQTLIDKYININDAINKLNELQEEINEKQYYKNIFNFRFCF